MAVGKDITQEDIRRGRRARKILEDPVFQEALEMADAQIIDEWRDADTTEEREHYHAQQEALPIIERQLRVLAGAVEWSEEQDPTS